MTLQSPGCFLTSGSQEQHPSLSTLVHDSPYPPIDKVLFLIPLIVGKRGTRNQSSMPGFSRKSYPPCTWQASLSSLNTKHQTVFFLTSAGGCKGIQMTSRNMWLKHFTPSLPNRIVSCSRQLVEHYFPFPIPFSPNLQDRMIQLP